MACLPASGFAQTDTINVYFGEGSATLSESSKQQIDSLIYYERLRYNIKLGIIGYADQVGTTPVNQKLSEARALAVKEYLLQSGFRQDSIQTVTGAGEIMRDSVSQSIAYPSDRKVTIIPGGMRTTPSKKKAVAPLSIVPAPKAIETPLSQLDVDKLQPNQTIRTNILFYPGSFMVLPQSDATLDSLYGFMKQNPTLKIAIEGHVCCVGDKPAKDELADMRASFIYTFLVRKGIKPERMTYKGFGNTRPTVWPEKTYADQRQNRRVEIRIINK